MTSRWWAWSRWRDRDDGGSWRGFEPTGVGLLVGFLPLALAFSGWPGLAVTLVALIGWADIRVTPEGVRARRWIGPVPWSWRRFPAGGRFDANVPPDGAPDAVLYFQSSVRSVDEHVLALRRDCETIARQLAAAAARAWAALGGGA